MADPTVHEIKSIVNEYDLHEIVEQDIKEINTQDKVDKYDDCIFLVLHFPKYEKKNEKYLSNEFNIVLGKDYIISVTKYATTHVEKIREWYHDEHKTKKDEAYKLTPYYILYKMLDEMYDKVLKMIHKFNLDLSEIEDKVFDQSPVTKDLLEWLLIKKRNILMLKHFMLPQGEILHELQKVSGEFYKWEIDVYFEDLEYKADRIMGSITIAKESTEAIANIYNTLANIKTNTVVSLLTTFTVIIWIMTMITGLFGMNVSLPWQQQPSTFNIIMGVMLLISVGMILLFKKKKRL